MAWAQDAKAKAEPAGKFGFKERPGRSEGWNLGGGPEVGQDLARDQAVGPERDHPSLAAAMRADEDVVDGEDALEELGPARRGRATRRRARGCRDGSRSAREDAG